MGLLPDMSNCGLRMRRECRGRFPNHRLQRKPLVNDPSMHHATCVTHVPWCMSGSLTRDGREIVPGIPGACTTRNTTYLTGGPLHANCSNILRHPGLSPGPELTTYERLVKNGSFYMVNIVVADVLATQGALASATPILTKGPELTTGDW